MLETYKTLFYFYKQYHLSVNNHSLDYTHYKESLYDQTGITTTITLRFYTTVWRTKKADLIHLLLIKRYRYQAIFSTPSAVF